MCAEAFRRWSYCRLWKQFWQSWRHTHTLQTNIYTVCVCVSVPVSDRIKKLNHSQVKVETHREKEMLCLCVVWRRTAKLIIGETDTEQNGGYCVTAATTPTIIDWWSERKEEEEKEWGDGGKDCLERWERRKERRWKNIICMVTHTHTHTLRVMGGRWLHFQSVINNFHDAMGPNARSLDGEGETSGLNKMSFRFSVSVWFGSVTRFCWPNI